MLSCKSYNWELYRIAIKPYGSRAKYKLPSPPAPSVFSEFAVGSTYYWLPYYNGIAIDLVLIVEDTSDRPLVALDYKWKWFYIDKTKRISAGDGSEILRGEARTLSSDIRIPFNYLPHPGQYELQVQITLRDKIIFPWNTMATVDISQWNKFVFGMWFALMGIIGIIIGVIIEKIH